MAPANKSKKMLKPVKEVIQHDENDAGSDDDDGNASEQHWKNTNLFSNQDKLHDDEDVDQDGDGNGGNQSDDEDEDDDNDIVKYLNNKRKNSEFTLEQEQENNKNNRYPQQQDDDVDDDQDDQDDEQDNKNNKDNKQSKPKEKRIPTGARKYLKGEIVAATGIKNPVLRNKVERHSKHKKEAAISAMRAEILIQSEAGFIEADENEKTYDLKQSDIVKAVDMQSKVKVFDLTMQHGPYSIDFTKEGRYVLNAGEKGHLSIIDWQAGKKIMETHLSQPARDACFLHNESMFAVAQKKYTYIYNSQGVQLHQLNSHPDPKYLTFLPYHFLLVSAGNRGNLVYEDISVGSVVAKHSFKYPLSALCQNRQNAVVNLGYTNGNVDLWIPKSPEPVVKILAHKSAITAMATSLSGNYLITAGLDRMVKIFDLRNAYDELHSFKVKNVPTSMSISDTNVLAIANGQQVVLWKNPFDLSIKEPYLTPHIQSVAKTIKFCPFEDVLGIGHEKGYSSILVPGAGQAQYDSMEADPFASNKMKKEAEVHKLLEKIPHDMITLNPDLIGTIHSNVSTEENKYRREAKKQVDKNRINIDPAKLKKWDEGKKFRKEKRESEILNPSKSRDALSRFSKNKFK